MAFTDFDSENNISAINFADLEGLNLSTEDWTAPVLEEFSFTPTSIDVSSNPQEVTFTIRVTDDLSGVDYASWKFISPSNAQSRTIHVWPSNLISGDSNDGVYQIVVEFPQFIESGVWHITYLSMGDLVANYREYSEVDLINMGLPTEISIIGGADLTPPEAEAFSFTPTTIDVSSGPQIIDFTVTLSDEVSGLDSASWHMVGPLGIHSRTIHVWSPSNLISGDENNGVYQISAEFPQFIETGTWHITHLSMGDKSGNGRQYSEAELIGMGFSTTIEIISIPDDTTPPNLIDFSFAPLEVDASTSSQIISFTVSLTDDFSGIDSASWTLASPSNTQRHSAYVWSPSSLISGDENNGVYQGFVEIPQYSEIGTWHIERFSTGDKVGNGRAYSENDLINMGIITTIDVVPPEPPFNITIDVSGVSTNIKVIGFDYIERGGIEAYELEKGTYSLNSNPGARLPSFNVEASGTISYDPEYEGTVFYGMGTKKLTVIGHPITIDPTGVFFPLKIYNLEFLSTEVPTIYNIPSDTQLPFVFFSQYNGFLENTTFRVTREGNVDYDPVFDGKNLNGLGTNRLEIIGYPITIDPTGVSIQLKIYNLVGYMSQDVPTVYNLPPETHHPFALFSPYNGYLDNATFKVTDGNVTYDSAFDGKTLNGLGTNRLEIIGHPITIDPTGVSIQLKIYNLVGYMSQDVPTVYNLPPDTHHPFALFSPYNGYLDNATFKVATDGTVVYDSAFDGKTLNGLGTSTLEIIGHPITIDPTGVPFQIKIYNLADYMSQDVPTVYYLPSDTHHPFKFYTAYNGYLVNATFKVGKDGKVVYDSALDGKTLNGLGTSMLEIIGQPITIDTSDASGNIKIYGLEYISTGGIETFYLPPDTAYPFILISSIYGGISETFTVFKDGTVEPTEIIFAGGIIRLYYDIVPPTTSITLSGTEGNNGWHTSDVEISLLATDDISGVEKTEYSLDGINWIEFGGSFTIINEGVTTIQYRSIDTIGNQEAINFLDIKIDKTKPDTTLEMNFYHIDSIGDVYVTSSTEFNLMANDQHSGIESIFYRINGEDWLGYTEMFTLEGLDGPYLIEYYSVDTAGNVESINSTTVNLANFEVNSYLSKGEVNLITFFDIIFTRSKQTGEYKLVATNPGQIFHITEVTNHWLTNIDTLTIEVIIPDDFIMKGSEPIHVYLDGVDITLNCLIEGNLITLQDVPSGSAIKVVVHLDYGLKGTIYANIDDFGMVGYVFETLVSGINDVTNLEQSTRYTATIITHQKKTTAIAGYVYNTNGEFLEGLTVKLYQNGVLISTTTTDENGFYYFIDIDEGDYEIHVLYDDQNEIQVATASKNELEEVNFELSYDPL